MGLQIVLRSIGGFGVALLPERQPQWVKSGRVWEKKAHDPGPADALRGREFCIEIAVVVASSPSVTLSPDKRERQRG